LNGLVVESKHRPVLDPDFVPAVLWNRAFEEWVEIDPQSTPVVVTEEFPEFADHLEMTTSDEKFKRYGQAIAAASLPSL